MKTILLTSAGLNVQDEILKILPKPASQIKIAHVITASKVEDDTSYLERENQAMKKLGVDVKNIDIEGKNEKELRNLLKDTDVIYVQGGNTFYLLKHVKESGFDRIVKDFIEKGVIYIGVSAGSYITCPTIEMAHWKHPNRKTFGLTDLSGLNLVPFLLYVHFKPEYAQALKQKILNSKYPVKILDDNQAILIQDESYKLVGKGEEIKL